MTNSYEVGDRVRLPLSTPFQTNESTPVAFDPDVVTFEVKAPGVAVATYVYDADANVVRLATGDYVCYVDVDVPGTWYYYVAGEQNDGENRGAAQGSFYVVRKETS